MKRAWSILFSVLLGAIVVGLGTGYFLHLANKDRQLLALEATQAKAEVAKAQLEQQDVVQQANIKLRQASEEVSKAQGAITALQEERRLLAIAKPLTPLPSQSMQGWNLVVSTAQNVALQFPPGSATAQDDEKLLAIAISGTDITSQTNDGPWLAISPFDRANKARLLARLATSTEVTYFIKGILLHGQQGTLIGGQTRAAVFDILQAGTSTRTVWIQTPPGQKPTHKAKQISLEDVLATFDFPKQP